MGQWAIGMLAIWGLGTAKHPCPQQLKSWAELCIGNVVNCSAAKQDQDPAATLCCFSRKEGNIPDFPSDHLWECNHLWGKSHRRAECTSNLKSRFSTQISWGRSYKLLEGGRTSTNQINYSKVYWTKQRQFLQIQATRVTVLCRRATIRYKTNKQKQTEVKNTQTAIWAEERVWLAATSKNLDLTTDFAGCTYCHVTETQRI